MSAAKKITGSNNGKERKAIAQSIIRLMSNTFLEGLSTIEIASISQISVCTIEQQKVAFS
jgi:hypothetical protein